MKFRIFSLLFVFITFSSFIFSSTIENNDSIPKLNREIISFVNANLDKKVGDGQCWALAAEALNAVNATWDHQYKYGREIQVANESVFPGDIIQFENVTIKYRKNGALIIERYPQHTAIIYEVKGDENYIIANQNVDYVQKIVLSELQLNYIIKGVYKIYRPVKI